MISKLFNHTDLLQKSLDVTALRQEVIANNIANGDTPGYKAQHVEFESVFRKALEGNGDLAMKTSSDRHIGNGTGSPFDVSPTIVTESGTTMRMDGNNVDVDSEMTELAANTIQYQTTIQLLNNEFSRLRTAIKG